jgi:hypothetical protein
LLVANPAERMHPVADKGWRVSPAEIDAIANVRT